MLRAAEQFSIKLENANHRAEPLPDMTYDVFLLRSSWLQVVRTILALVGKDSAEVCSHMMCDYLVWERSLQDSNLELKDGTEQLPSPQAKQSGKMQEERFFYGPFIQDSAVVLYDLFWHLTISDQDAEARPHYAKTRRTYLDEGGPRRSALALKLWKSISRIDVASWRKPMSISWRPYPYTVTKYKSSRRLISASMLFQGQALIRSKKLIDCIGLWKSGIPLCADGQEAHTTLLMGKISECLRQTQEYLRHGNIPEEYVVSAKEYFTALSTLLKILASHEWPIEHTWEKDVYSNYDDLMQHLLHAEKTRRMLVERGIDGKDVIDVDKQLRKMDSVLRSYLTSWSDAEASRPPPFRYVRTCNSILYRLVRGSSHSPSASTSALSFLRLMAEGRCGLPSPDRSTSTTLLRAGQEAGDVKIALAVMQALRGGILREAQERRASEGENVPASPSASIISSFLLLVDDALRRGDTDRMISLLESPKGSNSQRKKFRAALSSTFDVSLRRLVFYLYPSLHITRREGSLKRVVDQSRSERNAAMNEVAFHPRVLVAILQLCAEQGKTGLAERVWRMIKRASKPKTGQIQSAGWSIPIRAYTAMMNLYSMEVRRGTVNSNRSTTFRRNGVMQRRSGGEVQGWGRVRFGPLRDRLSMKDRLNRESTARFVVRQEYQELKESWKIGAAEPPNDRFWKAIERVFHRKGRSTGRLQLENEEDLAFYNSLKADMVTSNSSSES
jgi:hypothetical protein